MRKIRRKQAAVSAWILIATLGISPMVSAAAVPVEAENESMAYTAADSRNVGEISPRALDIEKASPSEPKAGEAGDETAEKTLEDKSGTINHTEAEEGAAEPEHKESIPLESDTEPVSKATPSEAIQEVQEATPSNAVIMARSTNLWGGMEMSDHFDGEGTEESPYQINSSKDLKLLAYNVSNEEVDGYASCYFTETGDTDRKSVV